MRSSPLKEGDLARIIESIDALPSNGAKDFLCRVIGTDPKCNTATVQVDINSCGFTPNGYALRGSYTLKTITCTIKFSKLAKVPEPEAAAEAAAAAAAASSRMSTKKQQPKKTKAAAAPEQEPPPGKRAKPSATESAASKGGAGCESGGSSSRRSSVRIEAAAAAPHGGPGGGYRGHLQQDVDLHEEHEQRRLEGWLDGGPGSSSDQQQADQPSRRTHRTSTASSKVNVAAATEAAKRAGWIARDANLRPITQADLDLSLDDVAQLLVGGGVLVRIVNGEQVEVPLTRLEKWRRGEFGSWDDPENAIGGAFFSEDLTKRQTFDPNLVGMFLIKKHCRDIDKLGGAGAIVCHHREGHLPLGLSGGPCNGEVTLGGTLGLGDEENRMLVHRQSLLSDGSDGELVILVLDQGGFSGRLQLQPRKLGAGAHPSETGNPEAYGALVRVDAPGLPPASSAARLRDMVKAAHRRVSELAARKGLVSLVEASLTSANADDDDDVVPPPGELAPAKENVLLKRALEQQQAALTKAQADLANLKIFDKLHGLKTRNPQQQAALDAVLQKGWAVSGEAGSVAGARVGLLSLGVEADLKAFDALRPLTKRDTQQQAAFDDLLQKGWAANGEAGSVAGARAGLLSLGVDIGPFDKLHGLAARDPEQEAALQALLQQGWAANGKKGGAANGFDAQRRSVADKSPAEKAKVEEKIKKERKQKSNAANKIMKSGRRACEEAGALADQAKGTGSLAKAKTLPPPKAAKMVSRFDTIAKSKRKLKPLEIKLEAIYIQDPGFKKYASLASSKDEQYKISVWFRDRRRSAERKRVRDLAAAGEL